MALCAEARREIETVSVSPVMARRDSSTAPVADGARGATRSGITQARQGVRRHLRPAARWLVIKALLVFAGLALLGTWAWRAAPRTLPAGWHMLLLPGVALALSSFLAYALRFRRVLRMFDLPLRVRDALAVTSFALFCQFFVPLGAGADLGKYVKLRSHAPQRRALVSAAAIVLEHLLGLVALLALACTSFIVLQPLALEVDVPLLAGGAVVVLALAALVLLRGERAVGLDARQLCVRLGARRGDALLALAWSLVMHLLLAAAVQVGARGLGVDIPFGLVVFVLTTANLLQAVPASLLGIGVADVAGTGLYVAVGQPLSSALLLASLLYAYRLLVALLGGLWELDGARRAWRVAANSPLL